MVVEVFRLRVPDFFLVDAVVGMEGNGPASPDLRDIGLILASDNAVALDAVMAAMMGCEPGRLRFLQKAKEAGLGDYDLSTIEILGRVETCARFQASSAGGRGDSFQFACPGHVSKPITLASPGRSGFMHRLRHLRRPVSGIGLVHG